MKEVVDKVINFIGHLSIVHIVLFILIMGIIIIGATVVVMLKNRHVEEKKYEDNEINEDDDLLGLLPDHKNKEDIIEPLSSLLPAEDEPTTLLDLESLTRELENHSYAHMDLEKYEKEEEERAIISYDELLENTGNLKINYAEETVKDGISVKKVDLNNLTSIAEDIPNKTTKVQLVSYEKEEAFLQALKELQQLLL